MKEEGLRKLRYSSGRFGEGQKEVCLIACCVFFLALAQALPLFFNLGFTNTHDDESRGISGV